MPTSDDEPGQEKKPDQEGVDIPFAENLPYPKSIPLNPNSGGFIHFMPTADPPKRNRQTAHIWGAVTTTDESGKKETTLMLRGQTQDMIEYERAESVQALQSVKWMHGKTSRVVRFDCVSMSSTTSIVKATVYELKNECPNPSRKEIDLETMEEEDPIRLDPIGQMELLKNEEPMYMDRGIKDMRIIPLQSSSPTEDPRIAIALIMSSSSSNNNNSIQVTILNLTIREGILNTTIEEKSYEDMPLPRSLKPFTGSGQEAGLLLVDFKPEVSTNRTAVVVEHIIPSSQSGWRRYTYKDVFESGTANGAWSVLVGNILALPTQSTQLLTLNTTYPLTTLRLYALSNPSQTPNPNPNPIHLLSTHTCTSPSSTSPDTNTNPIHTHTHLATLIPSYPPSKPGLDVLAITLLAHEPKTQNPPNSIHTDTDTHTHTYTYTLLFRTHRRTTTTQTAGGNPSFHSHDTCTESPIPDPLAAYPAYRSLKWLPTTVAGGFKPAVLEIFSWGHDGAVGVRLFAPPRRGGRYGVYECVGLRFWALDRGYGYGLGWKEDGVVSWGHGGGEWADSTTT